ncbi:MAG: type II secretion system protein GspM [Candidatus Competibacterales bacterium]
MMPLLRRKAPSSARAPKAASPTTGSVPSLNHRNAALGLLLALVGVGVVLFNAVWLERYHYYRQSQQNLQERLVRYRQLVASQPKLEAQLQAIRQDSSIEAYYLPPNTPVLAATDLQRRLRTVVQQTGGRLVSTQVLPSDSVDGVERVAIRAQLTGPVDVLYKVLYQLESKPPLLLVDTLQVRARTIRQRRRVQGGAAGEQRRPIALETDTQLTITLELAGFLPREAT